MNNPYVKKLEPVWRSLDYVNINEQKLEELIGKLKKEKEELKTPAWDTPNVHPPLDCNPAPLIDYICWVNAVNFAFTNFKPPYCKFAIEYPEGNIWQGAFALGASFMRAYNESMPVFDAKFMSRVSLKNIEHIFRPIDPDHKIPMIRERWRILRETGGVLLKYYRGSWMNLFLRSGFRVFNGGMGIVEQLVGNFPSFRDERQYKGFNLQFHKRAQLLAMMYHGRAVNSGIMPKLRDIEDVGPIADYEVPRALRFLEVLEYALGMEEAIQNRRVIKPGHVWETENRLAMSCAMERICEDVGITMDKADFYVWQLGRRCQQPHILVPTTDY